jgi:hypothetical protein
MIPNHDFFKTFIYCILCWGKSGEEGEIEIYIERDREILNIHVCLCLYIKK